MLSKKEFAKIVEDVVNTHGGLEILNYSVEDYVAIITFKSSSGKSQWSSRLDYTNGGDVNGHYTYTEIYPGTSKNWMIGNAISDAIKQATA